MIFPLAFLDSSSYWNTNHNQLQLLASNNITSASAAATGGGHESNNLPHDGLAAAAGTLPGGGARGGSGDGGAVDGPAKPMSMSELARLARVPQPEPGLNCPRCDSTNTKFCYFNNYSLTQPRHFCRACRRYWTRGGALRNVPIGGGYRRHAKRAKPKATPSAAAAASAPSSTTPGSCTTAAPSSLQAMLSNSAPPPSHRFADFDPASLGLSFPGAARLLFADTADAYAGSGSGNVHQGMDQKQWARMQSFPFLHAMDHLLGRPATAMPATMAMQGMFHLGLQSGGGGRGGGGGSGNGEVDGGDQFHATPAKRDQQDYTSRGIYGDVSGYTSYSSSSAAGN